MVKTIIGLVLLEQLFEKPESRGRLPKLSTYAHFFLRLAECSATKFPFHFRVDRLEKPCFQRALQKTIGVPLPKDIQAEAIGNGQASAAGWANGAVCAFTGTVSVLLGLLRGINIIQG